ncbi:MAG: helix-hairpin-helix domain-containing protein [Bacteroidales bacterium]|nr:helix-hairpin-helix domain-containing protein [Bacteroidales bacterium]
MNVEKEKKERVSKGVASGMVALVFLVLGFQLAIFVVKVVERPKVVQEPAPSNGGDARSEPGMTHYLEPGMTPQEKAPDVASKTKLGGYARPAATSRPSSAKAKARTYESFAFDPNTVSVADLQRLGLSGRQAESIENYRAKGGRFRSKADFQKMYVVSDTLFARLEPYIEIPKLELNTADSAALVSLRGIGPYYARKILSYRERLGGFVDVAQLREIEGIDEERFKGFAEQVRVDAAKVRRLDLWHASDSTLAQHPYLGACGARSVVRYRQLYDSARWTLPGLVTEQALSKEIVEKLKKYIEIQ